ncbi:MAG: CRISPR-associated endoribonuclease Cas6 [Bacteroidota bacterium]
MRIHIKFKGSNATIPINYQHLLTGTIHKWIGKQNQEHGNVSLYSFSWLQGTYKNPNENNLIINNNGSFFISCYNDELLQTIIKNIQTDPIMFNDLIAQEIIIQQNPDFENKDTFYAASPIFIKRKNENSIKHFTYSDEESNSYLKETLETKMALVGLKDSSLDISFDTNYKKATTKLIKYNSINNRASICPVIIKAKPETKAFAWNVGLGNSTGIGFGALK